MVTTTAVPNTTPTPIISSLTDSHLFTCTRMRSCYVDATPFKACTLCLQRLCGWPVPSSFCPITSCVHITIDMCEICGRDFHIIIRNSRTSILQSDLSSGSISIQCPISVQDTHNMVLTCFKPAPGRHCLERVRLRAWILHFVSASILCCCDPASRGCVWRRSPAV